jgi:SAM-dependent methyltransferase
MSPTPPGVSSPLPANYRYWREHGGEWGAEYENRKKRFLYYHIQEAMLCDYFLHAAPARILEYGCGVGRHLRYLSAIPGLDVHGYDQSQAMVDNCLQWASPQWLREHVTVGLPTGKLPYPDRHFDIVFTSEVLVHVRPDDLPGLLAELVRIARRQVFHMEPAPATQMASEAHDGCWSHDLVRAYAGIGRSAEILPPGFECQAPYRVRLDAAADSYVWPEAVLGLYRRMESDIQPELYALYYLREEHRAAGERLASVQEEAQSLNSQLSQARAEADGAAGQLGAERQRRSALEGLLADEQVHGRALEEQIAAEQARVVALDTQLQSESQERLRLGERVVALEAVVDERENRLRTLSTLTPVYFRLLFRKTGEYLRSPRKALAKLFRRG